MWCALTCLALMAAAVGADVIVYNQKTPNTIAQEFRDMPASFGPDVPFDGMRGFLIHGDPPDGCLPLAKPPLIDNITGRWFVIVARYNCSFEAKVRNAQAAGYDCAIVHNVNSSDLETMSAKDPDGITIPSLFVNEAAGLLLAEQYIFTNGFYIMLNGDLPFNINTHLLLPFAVVVVLCLTVILIFLIVKCIKDRRRARRHRLPSRALKKIPTCKFSKGDPYDTCAICLDDYQEGERLRVLPCAHAYHAKCVDPWLTQNRRVCPVCKRRVLSAGERRPRADSDTDDTEPLVDSPPPRNDTQGGTFQPQRENPFVRAARYVARLRRRDDANDTEQVVVVDPEDPEQAMNEETSEGGAGEGDGETDERAPLVRVVSERRRRGRRARRPRMRPAHPSINTHEHGEIGVAALPAPAPEADSNAVNL